MIVVRVELVSAVTGDTTELARMEIANKGTSPVSTIGNYTVRTLRGRSTEALDRRTIERAAEVVNWPRKSLHVWNLVEVALSRMGYGGWF